MFHVRGIASVTMCPILYGLKTEMQPYWYVRALSADGMGPGKGWL